MLEESLMQVSFGLTTKFNKVSFRIFKFSNYLKIINIKSIITSAFLVELVFIFFVFLNNFFKQFSKDIVGGHFFSKF